MPIGVILGLIIGFLNPFSNLGVKVLHSCSFFLDATTKLSWIWEGNKVQWTPRVASTHHLEWGKVGIIARCLVQCEFLIRKQLILPFVALLNENMKQSAQVSISYFNLTICLGEAICAKHEISAPLSPQGEPK